MTMEENVCDLRVSVRVVADLGEERIRNTGYRRGAEGDMLVGWGRRIVEWDFNGEDETPHEVVAATDGLWFSNGGCVLDVDGDGVDELVVARGSAPQDGQNELLWYKEDPDRRRWVEHRAAALHPEPFSAPHDLVPFVVATPEGQALKGVAAVLSRRELVWYEIGDDPATPWTPHAIGVLPAEKQSGMAVGDLASNGRPDLACGMFWAECPPDPRTDRWMIRRYGTMDNNGWGGMAKVALGDVDGDGECEIVASEAEIADARLAIYKRRRDDAEGVWECHRLDHGLYAPHSVVLADLDGDRRLDVVVGEMTAGGWSFPMHDTPTIFAYLNRGGGRFERIALVRGFGIHEMKRVPGSGEAELLLYGADEIQPQKFEGMNTRVGVVGIKG